MEGQVPEITMDEVKKALKSMKSGHEGSVYIIITRKVVRKELLQEMGEFDWIRKHVL